MNLTRLTHNGEHVCGTRRANALATITGGFRDWELIGLVSELDEGDDWEPIGVEVDEQSAATNSISMCAVYVKRNAPTPESSDHYTEQTLIDDGNTAIILFRGSDKVSWMRRMTPEQYDRTVIVLFKLNDDDLRA